MSSPFFSAVAGRSTRSVAFQRLPPRKLKNPRKISKKSPTEISWHPNHWSYFTEFARGSEAIGGGGNLSFFGFPFLLGGAPGKARAGAPSPRKLEPGKLAATTPTHRPPRSRSSSFVHITSSPIQESAVHPSHLASELHWIITSKANKPTTAFIPVELDKATDHHNPAFMKEDV